MAFNYDDEAATDDGTQLWNCVGCMDENSQNYDSRATVESDFFSSAKREMGEGIVARKRAFAT